MSEKTQETHVKIIKEALESNNLAIFVGSGISHCTAPDKYPLWRNICDILKNELGTEETDYLKLAQLYYLEFKELRTKKKIQSLFPEVDNPGELQRKILDLNPHYIITTNWDKLFDNEINNNADLYDIVVDDKSLVESTSDCKYIKMHGDFDHNNYVFTEDDYLNYSNNFPLLENYIKSIMSTHVVLFLGYSFNDIDLKQIETWIQNKSRVTPPIYMTKFSIDIKEIENKYLDKFRINILSLPTNEASEDSKKAALNIFLDNLLGIENNEIIENPEEYIYSRLSTLDKYPVILRRQIQEHLTNCGFEFDGYSRAILIFYKNILTTDFNKYVRDLYAKFVGSLPKSGEQYSKILRKILSILKKADIHGIIINKKDDSDREYYFSFDGENEQYQTENYECSDLSLNFLFEEELEESHSPSEYLFNSRNLFQLGKIEDAFSKTKLALQIAKKNKDYKNMFISMFNYNFLLHHLKFNLLSDEKYKNFSLLDLDKEFYKLRKKTQIEIRDILDFINFNYIYREIVSVDQGLAKVLNAVSCIKDGGFSFSNDSYQFLSNHKNLIDFAISNYLLIENYTEYKAICAKYVQIAFNRQFNKPVLHLNKYELFSCIKHISNKELQKDFKIFFDNKKWKGIEVSDADISWLINQVFCNCVKYYKETDRINTSFEQYIENTILLLAMIQMSEDNVDKVIIQLNKFIQEAKNTLNTFASINSFFSLQYKYNKKNPVKTHTIIDMLNIIIDKFITGRCNGYEYTVISENRIPNLFGYMTITNAKYEDINRISVLINKIEDLEIKKQYDFCINLLFQVYQISNESVKEIIKNYVLQDKFTNIEMNKDNQLMFLILNLSLQILEITKLSDDFILLLENTIDTYPKNKYSSTIYQIICQVDFLSKKDKRFNKPKEKVDLLNKEIKQKFYFPSRL